MNLHELESFKLSDAVVFHDQLNPELWQNQKLRPEVKRQLIAIADDFVDELGISDLNIKDITVSGSNAAYSYTKHSDLDLHILVDMSDFADNEIYQELFNAKKLLYNDTYDITVHGIPVELYVQDANEPVVSLGEYSIKKDKWLKIPTKRRANFDQTASRLKYDKIANLIEIGLKSQDIKKVDHLLKIIRRYRKAGLDKGGEFSPENLAYKVLRSKGYIDKLYDLLDKLHSQELTIEDYDPNGTPPGPEFKPTMPAGTVRVDVSDVYDWYKLGQHISNLKGLGKHDFGAGPPSTIMAFGSEPEEHKYIKDLEKTGLTTTDIDPVDTTQPKGMKRQKVDPTFNVSETDWRESKKPTIGINVRSDKDRDYALLIVDGKKKYESRKSDSLRPYVGKTVAIIRTGSGPAAAIGQVTIGEPIIVDAKKFDMYRKYHLVPKGSKFDIDDDGIKYLYPMINPVRWADEKLIKHKGIVSRKIQEQGVAEGVMKDFDIDLQEQQWEGIVGYVINGLKKGMDTGRIELNLYQWASKELFDVDQALEDHGFSDVASLARHIQQHGGKYEPPSFDLGDLSEATSLVKTQSKLHEAFDKPYEMTWEKSEFGDYDALTKLDDGTYLSIMFNKENAGSYQVEFYRNNSLEVTGEGDSMRVFATVLTAIEQFIKKKKPASLTFSASKEVEPGQNFQSRAKLYDRLVQRYAASLGYRSFRAETGTAVHYELNKKEQGVTESKTKHELTDLDPWTFDQSQTQTMKHLVKQVYDKYSSDPVDACWHATRDLAKLLSSNGIHGSIVKGDVQTEWDTIQHHWIVVDDIILDPTYQQLDGKKMIFKDTDPDYEKYDAEYSEWNEF